MKKATLRRASARYFPETDSLGIDVADGPAVRTVEVASDIIIGYDEAGEVVSIEFPAGVRKLFADLLKQAKE